MSCHVRGIQFVCQRASAFGHKMQEDRCQQGITPCIVCWRAPEAAFWCGSQPQNRLLAHSISRLTSLAQLGASADWAKEDTLCKGRLLFSARVTLAFDVSGLGIGCTLHRLCRHQKPHLKAERA